MRFLLFVLMILSTVSLAAQSEQRSLSVGDTVVLKARHRTTGVVLAFTGPGSCPPCVRALVDLDKRLSGTRLPIEVYVGDGLESPTAYVLKEQLTYAKLYDDETYATAQQYRVLSFPTFAFVSPNGVVRYIGLPGIGAYNVSELTTVIGSILSEGSLQDFRGPRHLQANLVRSMVLPKEVLDPTRARPRFLYDYKRQRVLCWTTGNTNKAFVLDSLGRIEAQYDFSQAAGGGSLSTLDLRNWDSDRDRVLLTNYAGASRTFLMYWYDLRTRRMDTIPFDLEERIRGSDVQYHPTMDAYVQTIHLPYIHSKGLSDSSTLFVQMPQRKQFVRRKSSLYARDSFYSSALYASLSTCPDGLLTSQVFTDTVYLLSGPNLTERAFPVSLPEQYRVPHNEGMEQYRSNPAAIRSGKTFYTELLSVYGDWSRPNFMAQFMVPSKVLDNVERKPFFDNAFIMVDYNMAEQRIESMFELPQSTYPFAVHNGTVVCEQFESNPPRIMWFSAPVSSGSK